MIDVVRTFSPLLLTASASAVTQTLGGPVLPVALGAAIFANAQNVFSKPRNFYPRNPQKRIALSFFLSVATTGVLLKVIIALSLASPGFLWLIIAFPFIKGIIQFCIGLIKQIRKARGQKITCLPVHTMGTFIAAARQCSEKNSQEPFEIKNLSLPKETKDVQSNLEQTLEKIIYNPTDNQAPYTVVVKLPISQCLQQSLSEKDNPLSTLMHVVIRPLIAEGNVRIRDTENKENPVVFSQNLKKKDTKILCGLLRNTIEKNRTNLEYNDSYILVTKN